jgi:ubiquinone/menaquinone biosynthesis C-methylase UbiE
VNEFDTKAAEWDNNPMHWDRSEAVANGIKGTIPLNTEMSVLEYGAGTGITSFLLKDLVKEITLMDISTGMLNVLNEKIKTSGARNLKTLNFNLENTDYKDGKFDLVFTQMVLHHVTDIDSIISRFNKLLNPGGYLAIADLYEEDGSFHGEEFNGHRGFEIEKLSGILRKNNFSNITHKTCFTIEHIISDTNSLKYDVFLLTGRNSVITDGNNS